jgi:RNA polymerase nonessential primary-like sigma factor
MSEESETPLLTPEEALILTDRAELAREQYQDARQAVTAGFLRLVVSIAKEHTKRGCPFVDLVEQGNIGLTHAVDVYKRSRDGDFEPFAAACIRQRIKRIVP